MTTGVASTHNAATKTHTRNLNPRTVHGKLSHHLKERRLVNHAVYNELALCVCKQNLSTCGRRSTNKLSSEGISGSGGSPVCTGSNNSGVGVSLFKGF